MVKYSKRAHGLGIHVGAWICNHQLHMNLSYNESICFDKSFSWLWVLRFIEFLLVVYYSFNKSFSSLSRKGFNGQK